MLKNTYDYLIDSLINRFTEKNQLASFRTGIENETKQMNWNGAYNGAAGRLRSSVKFLYFEQGEMNFPHCN